MLAEREAKRLEQGFGMLIVGGRGADGDVHPPHRRHPVEIDLGEDELLGHPEAVVAAAIEGPRVEAAEVPDARDGDGQEPVEELPHPVAPHRHRGPHRHPLTDLESGDRLPGLVEARLLTGDERKLVEGRLDRLAVGRRLRRLPC